MVHVDHRRLHVRVAHPRLNAGEWSGPDGERSEGVAQVVEDDRVLLRAEVTEVGALERGVERAAS
jgi:hypothetical protein